MSLRFRNGKQTSHIGQLIGMECYWYRSTSLYEAVSVPGLANGSPNVDQAPQIFWFQQQKYVFLKFRLFLYSGKINTRIS